MDLNTSHVKVQADLNKEIQIQLHYLNTSHVKVQAKDLTMPAFNFNVFKYISC